MIRGLAPPRDQDRRDLLEICDDRYAARSTILTSQLEVGRSNATECEGAVGYFLVNPTVHSSASSSTQERSKSAVGVIGVPSAVTSPSCSSHWWKMLPSDSVRCD